MPLTNPPFTRDPKQPPLHLREWTAEELDQHRRMVEKQESMRRPKEDNSGKPHE